MKKKDWNKFVLVFLISFIAAVFSIFHVLLGYARSSPGLVYMWTGHYYLDYFQYVQSFAQGMQGKWLLDNPLTTENTSTTFIGMWQNLLFGKLGYLFHLSPIGAYWWTVFLLLILFGFLIFKLIQQLLKKDPFGKQLAAYSLILFAAPFYEIIRIKGKIVLQYFSFWSDKSVLWKRFESIPYHLTANILTIFILLWFARITDKLNFLSLRNLVLETIGISGLIVFLLTFSPATALLLIVTLGLFNLINLIKQLFLKNKINASNLLIFSCIFLGLVLPAAFLIRNSITDSYYKIAFDFEKNWQIKTDFRLFFLTHGPLFLLSFPGLRKYLKEFTPIRAIFLLFILISYIFFFSPIPGLLNTTNTRFLSPLSYTLFGVLAVIWIKKAKNLLLSCILLLLFFLPVNIKAFQDLVNDKNIFSPISYLPKTIIDGFKFLGKEREKGNVLLPPSQFLGCVLPIYADRKVYVARHNITINYLDKNIRTGNFYLGVMTEREAADFLRKNDLKFVILTSIEGYDVKQLFKYPFLKEIYRNKDIIIFKTIYQNDTD